MERFLAEKLLAKIGVTPVNLNTAANVGSRFDMKNCKRLTFIAILGGATSSTAHSFALKQSNAATSGTTKALQVSNPYYHKVGSATKFTKVDPAGTLADTYDLHALVGDNASIVIFEVLAEDLDRTNGFEWVELDIAVTGVTQLGSVLMLGDESFGPAYAQIA